MRQSSGFDRLDGLTFELELENIFLTPGHRAQ
jgi:hypothetical protein